jgi:DNA-binding NarL/FixJ family response regulator
MIKTSLVEDDQDFQKHLAEVLSADPEIELCGVYCSAEDFMAGYAAQPCEVVVMDINLPGATGIACVRQMKAAHPQLLFTMCSIFEDYDQLYESLKAGAVGYILKHQAIDQIANAVKDVHLGGSPISPTIANKLVQTFYQKPERHASADEALTKREREILDLLTQGFRYKEIADQLNISVETVRTHVRNLYEKLHVQSRTEAINKVFGQPRG